MLRIEPDRLSIVYFQGDTIEEADSTQVETAANTWYTVKLWQVSGGPDDGTITVLRTSDIPGDAVAFALNAPLSDAPPASAIGFTVGAMADYHFQLDEYALAPDTSEVFIDWEYDAFGRKVAETVYNDTNSVTSQTLFAWDGWRLVSELDGLNGNTVIAEYVPGPAYVDDTVAVRRELDLPRNGIQSDEVFYYLTDQQYSTVALLDVSGIVVERYGYDAFGAPTIHNAEATDTLGQSAVGNSRLYTGRDYLPTLGLYDYRHRRYDPDTGRFLTTDPIGSYGDPNNLGNPYTYVGNNPGTFVDPFGLESWSQYFWSVYTEPVYAFFGGNLGGDNSQAHDRYLERQSLRSDPRLNVDALGSGDTRYATIYYAQVPTAASDTAVQLLDISSTAVSPLGGPPATILDVVVGLRELSAGNLVAASTSLLFVPGPGKQAELDLKYSNAQRKPSRDLPINQAPYQLTLFPDEPYDRTKHYGRTPTAAQRASVSVGMEFDHHPPLLEHYYEGLPGDLPGFNLTAKERLEHAQDIESGRGSSPTAQRVQGALAAAYSKLQKLYWGFD